ncbi:hypothetical protein GN244_ATG19195 [Phytophthora infestans]|uniref:Reverse transcriptase RNase H-like domain-containing protein n=1 Tax=Phytophthora infestans TaxID=4787 RepID=A0A833SM93_PHYIN|nr:hypothetical protein GN244_ATG19195 [Phytophthora infestans]
MNAALYSVPHNLQAAKLEGLERLVRLEILEPDKDSSWAAPAIVISKTDDSVRFLSEFRRRNRWLWRSYFPLPKIKDLIRELPQPCLLPRSISEWDIISRSNTAMLPWKKYRCCRLSMGISTAPHEFHADMTQILGNFTYVRIYLDDVLTLSQTFDEHLEHIQTVLNVDYLGYSISTEGKRSIASRLRIIRDLRRFIGMVNYYMDLWPSRSQTLAPLTALTSSRVSFRWGPREQAAFDGAKEMISQATLLAYPDFDIYTDASDYQLGEGKPLHFGLKVRRHTAQIRYQRKRIAQCLFDATRISFDCVGQKIRVFTDHRNSTFQNITNWTMFRWRLDIEEYGPERIYIQAWITSIKDEQVKAMLKPTDGVVVRELIGVKLLTTVKDGNIAVPLPLRPAIMRTYH